MKSITRFSELLACSTESSWRNKVFRLSQEMGYVRTMLAIKPNCDSKSESGKAFLQSNYPTEWRRKYDSHIMRYDDPIVAHCATKSTPLIWSPEVFAACKRKEMYEEACSNGLRVGITLPMHGSGGELGMLSLLSDLNPYKQSEEETFINLPELSYFRDFVCETAKRFMRRAAQTKRPVTLTKRELECLKLCGNGKSSWDIGQILKCSESGVNFHFKNIRIKFGVTSRHQALVKAIQLGLITPS